MNNKLVLVFGFCLLLLPMATAHTQNVYDGYYRYYNPSHRGFYESHDFQYEQPRIIYEYNGRSTRRYNPYYVPNEYKLNFFKRMGYYDPDEFTEEEFERCHYYGDCPPPEEDEDERFRDFRREALSVQRGSYEYFGAGYHAASNYEIAFKKGYNDGYYGKKAYFDDDHELTTWYREAYLNGWYSGLEDRNRYDHPG